MTPGLSDDALHKLTDQQLLDMLAETDMRLGALQAEIRRRMQRRTEDELEAAQHAEISKLMDHLDQATVDWPRVREFFRHSFGELQDARRIAEPKG